jgi:beta-galactosidase
VALDGVRITTPDIDPERAIVAVATTVENETRFTRTVRLDTRVVDPHGTVAASGSAPLTLLPNSTAVSRVRLAVRNAQLWSPDSPALYEINTTVADGDVLDREHNLFGIRRLQLDPEHGLRINGEPVNLRGACVHHDAGALGAAAISRAEVRRVEILKEAGFNAIRSAHNPISRATLQACDRLGVLVMDELTDVWTEAKSPFDYTLSFPEWWERDLEAMVAKDFNHPSVIMYSIGNEIFEVGTPIGSTWGRKLAEKVRSLDDTRFVTNAINGMVAVIDRLGEVLGGQADEPQDVNTMIATLGDAMNQLSASEPVTEATEESAAMLDVVGFNYGDSRHEPDTLRFPNRVIVGSETFPGHIDELWRLVRANPHVIGDFTWTGWDYLGEAGLGRVDYPTTTSRMASRPLPLARRRVRRHRHHRATAANLLLPGDCVRAPEHAVHRRAATTVPQQSHLPDAVVLDRLGRELELGCAESLTRHRRRLQRRRGSRSHPQRPFPRSAKRRCRQGIPRPIPRHLRTRRTTRRVLHRR